MRLTPYVRAAGLALLAGGLVLAQASGADAKRERWKLASSYGSNLDVIGGNITRVLKNIDAASDGDLKIQFFEPGALVPALQVFDATSTGSIDAAYSSAGFHAGKLPQAIFFASVPFGPSVNEYFGWMVGGGGYELYAEEYGKYNVVPQVCGIVVAESSGWFRKEVSSTEDLRGMKMRFYGLGAKVMEKFGVSTQLLAGGDIYPALELGSIDATEFSYPTLDKSLGFYQIAKHNYFPGWHQQASLLEIIMNGDKWKGLTDAQRKTVELACGEANIWSMGKAEATQGEAIAFHKSKGVAVHKWPDETIAKFQKAWDEVAQEQAAANPDFKRIFEAYTAFRDKYRPWKELGYLK